MLLRANSTVPRALFVLPVLGSFIMWGWGVVSARLESVGKACDPLTTVNRCYLTTPLCIVRSLD